MLIFYRKFLKESRRVLRKLSLQILSQELSDKVIRNQLDLDFVSSQSELTFELASDTQTLYEALHLVQKSFYKMGYSEKSTVRLTPYHLLPETVVGCVKYQSKVIASMTIIPHSAFGLPLQSCVSIDEVLLPNKTLELSALAVDQVSSGQRGEVLYNLLKFIYHCGIDLLDAEMEVIGVNPLMVPLYRSIMLFKSIPGTSSTSYNFANGAVVEPMYLDLRNAKEQYSEVYQGASDKTNLMKFFLSKPPSYFIFPKKESIQTFSPQNKVDSLQEILSWKPEVLSEIDDVHFHKMIELHGGNPDCQELLRETRSDHAK